MLTIKTDESRLRKVKYLLFVGGKHKRVTISRRPNQKCQNHTFSPSADEVMNFRTCDGL